MKSGLKVLFVGSEMAPFAKSGGLGDVLGSLPKELRKHDLDIRVMIPRYKTIDEDLISDIKFVKSFNVEMGISNQQALCFLEDGELPTYFIENYYYFYRDGFYGYDDDGERFGFFTRAVLESLKYIDFKPDIIHFNDWQTGLGPMLLKDYYSLGDFYKNIKSIFTIHNIQYQGVFPVECLDRIGIHRDYFQPDRLEFYGKVNFMKAGIKYADMITTVSETYSKEIQSPEYSYMLDGVLKLRKCDLTGIVNGIDTEMYDPMTNKSMYNNFDLDSIEIKYENKKMLQSELGLEVRDVPVISIISRLVSQKGMDLISYCIEEILAEDVQIVVLGTGENKYEEMFKHYAHVYPEKVSANIFFSEDLATKIYSSADMFLMPSLFEPCGLSQLIAMRFGNIPIVRNTGGLADTVKQFDRVTGKGNGYVFNTYDHLGLLWAIKEALYEYNRKDSKFLDIIKNAMLCDFSWNASAKKYVDMYSYVITR